MEPEQITHKHFCSFSEAIREGARLRPQAFGELLLDGKTCAIGAGLEAMGYADIGDSWLDAARKYPYLAIHRTEGFPCPIPECFCQPSFLYRVVIHLNDHHRWSREQIADWLESEEEKLGFVTLIEGESSRAQVEVSEVVMA